VNRLKSAAVMGQSAAQKFPRSGFFFWGIKLLPVEYLRAK